MTLTARISADELTLHITPKTKVQGIQVGTVRWPNDFTPSANDTPLEYFRQKLECNVGTVWWGSILHEEVPISTGFAFYYFLH